ncbi:aldehyde dehydrogenase family protein [Methanosarcina barkeri]|uniref:aldehyde dehydrogenase family protein n=1 Tax=Methanosarcina barkeri TaxID=2208 RepID=UPI002436A41C|nr:aldehyde dehydrogenase family protein [Methanosarcina barkeri]
MKQLKKPIIPAMGLVPLSGQKNLDRARAGCEQLNAGIIWLNQHLKVAPEVPFGGTRESGIGRENGPDALSEYLDLKTVMLKI